MNWNVGRVNIARIVEIAAIEFPPEAVVGGLGAQQALALDWMQPHFCNAQGQLILSFHAFLVRTRERTILIDTCFGAGRQLPAPMFSNLGRQFLDNLAAEGIQPDDIDTVMCTHMHYDHVGWNTREVDGRWVPTFPNARYLYSAADFAMTQSRAEAGDEHAAHFADTILPPASAGLVDYIDTVDGHRLCQEISLFSTPGHSPDHFSVLISSQGQRAVITGDVLHNPVQCAYPGHHPDADEDKELAAVTRRKFLERFADEDVLILGTHFPSPTAGFVQTAGGAWRFSPATRVPRP
jgi:glyoxylase-like metal-dependent hydrolase (beta-lactamase superfamily II)